jgi:hypothetical protein
MVNKFEKRKITTHFFDSISNLKNDLLIYLYNNLQKENYQTFSGDLNNALTNYANGEYI